MSHPSGIDYMVQQGDRQTVVSFTNDKSTKRCLFLGGEERMEDVIAFLRNEMGVDAGKTMLIVSLGHIIDVITGKDFVERVDPRRGGASECVVVSI